MCHRIGCKLELSIGCKLELRSIMKKCMYVELQKPKSLKAVFFFFFFFFFGDGSLKRILISFSKRKL